MLEQTLQEITVITYTYERKLFAMRSAKYFDKLELNHIIVDGSSEASIGNFSNYGKLRYFFLPNLSMIERIRYAIKNCKSSYTIICADDEFLTKAALFEAASILKEDIIGSISSVQPRMVGFSMKKNMLQPNLFSVYPEQHLYISNSISIQSRVCAEMLLYSPRSFYGLYRTKQLLATYESMKCVDDDRVIDLHEILRETISSIQGRRLLTQNIGYFRSFEELTPPWNGLFRKTYANEYSCVINNDLSDIIHEVAQTLLLLDKAISHIRLTDLQKLLFLGVESYSTFFINQLTSIDLPRGLNALCIAIANSAIFPKTLVSKETVDNFFLKKYAEHSIVFTHLDFANSNRETFLQDFKAINDTLVDFYCREI